MPTFEMQTPSGETFEIEGSDAAGAVAAFKKFTATQDSGVGAGDVARSALGQGFALGFGDEIEAFVRSKVKGTKFDDEVKTIRSEIEQFGENHPAIALGSEIAGAMFLPVGGALRGATVAGRAARSALVGSGVGAGFGAGTAEGGLEERAKGAGIGAVAGAIGGGAAPFAIEGAVRGGRAAVRALSKAGAPVRAAVNPTQEAALRVAETRTADRALGQGLAAPEAAMAQRAGQPVANIDIGGETTQRLARSASNTSPQGGAQLNKFINERFEGQAARVEETIDTIMTPKSASSGLRVNITDRREQLQKAAREARAPLYKRAFAEGDGPIKTDILERLTGSPEVVKAMRGAAVRGKDRAALEGFGGFNNAVQISDDGLVKFTQGPNGQPTFPNLAFWDATKRELDDAARKAFRSGANEEGTVISGLARQLREELDTKVPSYANARSTASRFFGADEALEAGEKFARAGRVKIPEARAALGKMSKAERDLFAEGFADELVTRVNRLGDRRNVVQAMFSSPEARGRIGLALGPKRTRMLEARLRIEGLMDLARNAVQGNSTTARQLSELGLAGSAGGFGGFTTGGDPTTIILAALAGRAGARIANRSRDAVGREVARLLVSGDLQAVDRATRLVASRANLLSGLRRFDNLLAKAGGQRASGTANQLLESQTP